MAEGRFLSRSISTNEQLATCSIEASLLFTWCLSHLDVDGRLLGSPMAIKANVVALRDEITIRRIPFLLKELGGAVDAKGVSLVVWYEVGRQQVLYFPGFERQQKGLRRDREATSKLPPVQQASRILAGTVPGVTPVPTPAPTPGVLPDERREKRSQGKGKGEVEEERSGIESTSEYGPGDSRELDRAARSSQNGKHPPPASPASPLAELPAVRDFVRTFYPKASTPPERRKDIAAQLEATLTVGAKHKRQLVHAYSRERLELKCREVIQEGVRDPDKAIVVLLTKLGDTSDNAAPGQREERRAAEERHVEERSSAQDLEHAEAWIASEPDVQSTFAELLTEALELHSMPLGADDELDALQLSARRIVRRNLALMHWRNSGAPIVETA